jgi:hypothetical protein
MEFCREQIDHLSLANEEITGESKQKTIEILKILFKRYIITLIDGK